MTSSVDGLVSGLSTSSLIQQLMKAEAAPQQRLQLKVSNEQKKISAYQAINARMAALETAAKTLKQATTWSAVKATVSSDAVSATPANGAATGSLTFDVISLAKAQVSTAVVASPNDPVTADASIGLTIGGSPVTVTLGTDKTAQGVANSINAAGIAVKAAVVTTGDGTKLLQLSASNTGSAGVVAVTSGLAGLTFNDATVAVDARIQVGDPNLPNSGAYTVTSSTNTFTGLMNGVTLTVKRAENNVTVGVATDVDGMAAKIQSLVDAANSALGEVNSQTAFNVDAKTKQPLTGDATMRQLASTILSAVGGGVTTTDDPNLADINRSFKKIGVELDRSGKLSFKKDAFVTAYTADPATVKSVATTLGTKLEKLADDAQVTITSNTQSRDRLIRSLNTQIDNWSVRLEARQNALQRQFTNLEVSLGKLKDQSNWLAGQIASLG